MSHSGIGSASDKRLFVWPGYGQPPQDLSTAAGPDGPGTTTVWPGSFFAVNDKGHCVAMGFDGSVYSLQAETHALTQLPQVGYLTHQTSFAISARDTIAGTLARPNGKPLNCLSMVSRFRLQRGAIRRGSFHSVAITTRIAGFVGSPTTTDPCKFTDMFVFQRGRANVFLGNE